MIRPLLLLATLVAAPVIHGQAASASTQRPNVLFIAVDDLRDWVGYLKTNPQTITPNIDRLAARGLSFSHSYCAAPVCNPSRAALMSGLRPSTSGVYANDDDWRTVIPAAKTLTTAFRKAGYFVAGAGKIYHESYARRSEWDDYLTKTGGDPQPEGSRGVGGIQFAPLDCKDEDLREWKIVEYGREQLARTHDKPFFLAIGLHKPHMPWNVPRKYFDLHPLADIQLPPIFSGDLDDLPARGISFAAPNGDHRKMLASGRWKEAIQAYLAAISYADAMIGRLLDGLDVSPHRDNMIVVLWGDHGWHLGEKEHWRKFALWETTTRTPLIWVAPGLTKAGSVCERPIDFMTIYPTLTDLAGIATPAHVEGKSIRTLLADPQAPWSEPAVTTYEQGNHTARVEGWRYIRYSDGGEELYDEVKDPNEWANLAKEAAFFEKRTELAKLLPTSDAPDITGGGKRPKAKRKRAIQATEPASGRTETKPICD